MRALNKLVHALYTPVRVVDRTVKLGYDIVSDVVERTTGKDRFDLAAYSAYGSSIFLFAEAVNAQMSNKPLREVIYLGATVLWLPLAKIGSYRDYFKNPKDALNYGKELSLNVGRLVRLPIMIGSAYVLNDMFNQTDAIEKLQYFIVGASGFPISSHFYFLDGDHALWDRTKQRVRDAYRKVKDAMQPQLKPEPSPA